MDLLICQNFVSSSWRLHNDDSLGEIVHTTNLPGKIEGAMSYAHQCIWDKTQTFLFVVTQGRNKGYEFDSDSGKLA